MYHLIYDQARALRKAMTLPEVLLWQRLRAKRLGFKFRRQSPVGPYILDFYCVAAKLAVELDGRHHEKQAQEDEERSRWLGEKGITVIRFRNEEILKSIEEVVKRIQEVLSGE